MEARKGFRPIPASPWAALERELDAWAEAGRKATLWWRDDDATLPCAAFDRLLEVRSGLPLAIAVIPARTNGRLADRLAREAGVSVIQHGFSHRNHAPPGAKKCEFPGSRPTRTSIARLAHGRRRLARLFGGRFAPVLAPPWNRIDPAVARAIGAAGLYAVSGFGTGVPFIAGRQINAHLDPIDWRGTRGFIGAGAALHTLTKCLAMRRHREIADLPSGLLTHHRENDDAVWRFLSAFVEFTCAHSGVRWVSIEDLLRGGGSGSEA
jgi:peptidoglycan/xylan/chitin deacetylase (PgdA/CDA1 family)